MVSQWLTSWVNVEGEHDCRSAVHMECIMALNILAVADIPLLRSPLLRLMPTMTHRAFPLVAAAANARHEWSAMTGRVCFSSLSSPAISSALAINSTIGSARSSRAPPLINHGHEK